MPQDMISLRKRPTENQRCRASLFLYILYVSGHLACSSTALAVFALKHPITKSAQSWHGLCPPYSVSLCSGSPTGWWCNGDKVLWKGLLPLSWRAWGISAFVLMCDMVYLRGKLALLGQVLAYLFSKLMNINEWRRAASLKGFLLEYHKYMCCSFALMFVWSKGNHDERQKSLWNVRVLIF